MVGSSKPLLWKKKKWGPLTGRWVPHDTRDEIVDFARSWADKCDIPMSRFVDLLHISRNKFHDWIGRFGNGSRSGLVN